jgi:outer membrane usher protein
MVVKFPVQKVLSANITLHDTAGQPLKLGTLVTEQTTQQTTVVGYDGLVYFSHLQPHGQLSIQQEDRSMCRVDFDLNPNYHSIEQVGPLVCQVSAEEKKS